MLDDVVLAIRVLRRQPLFTLTAVIILALGIGANGAIFSIVHSVLLRPLPFRNPEQLYYVWRTSPDRGMAKANLSPSEFRDFSTSLHSFSAMAAESSTGGTLLVNGVATRVRVSLVTPGYFEMLGVRPAFGRSFTAEEGIVGRDKVAVLSASFWSKLPNSNPSIVGKSIEIDKDRYLVVGVLPTLKGSFEEPDLYLPAAFNPKGLSAREARYLTVSARLRDGVTQQQALQEMRTLAERLAQERPDTDGGWSAFLSPLHETLTGDAKPPLMILFSAVGLVLLIACGNLANLLLVRATARRKELAVRSALGALQVQIFRQLMIESIVLAVAGAATGTAVAWWMIVAIRNWSAVSLPRLTDASLDLMTIAFMFLLAVASGILFGIAPAWSVLRLNLADVLRDDTRGGAGSVRRTMIRSSLVVAEVALSVILLASAGLLFRTFQSLSRVDAGFSSPGVLTFSTTLSEAAYATPELRDNYVHRMLDRLKSMPGVVAAGATTSLPMNHVNWMANFKVPGRADAEMHWEMASYNTISPGYLETIGARIVRGRGFQETDRAGSTPVLLVSEAFVRHYFPNSDPLGRAIKLRVTNFEFDCTIVGVVHDIRHLRLDEGPRIALYQPHAQLPWPFLNFAVKTSVEPESLIPSVRRVAHDVDPELAIDQLRPLSELVDDVLAQQRLALTLLSGFSAMAVILAAVGLYGVLGVAVAQRVKEFGIRQALGASSLDLLLMVLRQGAFLTGVGLIVGLGLALLSGRLMSTLLYGVKPNDPATLASVAGILLVTSLAACAAPAVRAAKVDPCEALRTE